MKISVITVCFNSEKTILRTVKSVLKQVSIELEYLLIDGGSRDRTESLIRGVIDGRCLYISETDEGIYDAMNKGIRLATGDVIGFLNSDDFFRDEFCLFKILKAFELSQDIGGIYSDLVYVDSKRNVQRRYWHAGHYNKVKLYFGWMPPHPTVYLRATVIKKAGYFLTHIGTAADYDFLLRILIRNNANLLYINEVLVRMEIGGASNASPISYVRSVVADTLSWNRNSGLPNPLIAIFKIIRKIPQFFFHIKS